MDTQENDVTRDQREELAKALRELNKPGVLAAMMALGGYQPKPKEVDIKRD